MPYFNSLDIGNRALQFCGADFVASVTEDSKNNTQASFSYDKLKRAELRRNIWAFSTRRAILRAVDTTTLLLTPRPWSALTLYLPGSIVSDSNGLLWYSTLPDNKNNQPGVSTVWDRYFGPLTVSLYDSKIAYWSGELVYMPTGNPGGFVIFISLLNSNTDTPTTAVAYDATVTYGQDAVVTYSGSYYRSLIAVNKANTPADAPAAFDISTIYTTSDKVTASDGFIYSSVGTGNVGHVPETDGGVHWTNTAVPGAWALSSTLQQSSPKWLPLYADGKNILFVYPLGTGPVTETATKNVFHLPSGYLRHAPGDPKAGSVSYLGMPSNLAYNDWLYEGGYIVTRDTGPVLLRFVADIFDVTKMDDLFCEGLAASMALSLVEPLTQSAEKMQTIRGEYARIMSNARLMNFIEAGAIEAELDDWIACRI